MYKWKVEWIMKNGEHVYGHYYGNETDSLAVMKALMVGDPNSFNGAKTTDERGTVAVRNGDISAIIVSQ